MEELIRKGKKDLAESFTFKFGYIDEVLSLIKHFFDHAHQIWAISPELEIKDTPLHQQPTLVFAYNMTAVHLITKPYDQLEYFDCEFAIVNISLDSSIRHVSATYSVYSVYRSQLMRYARTCYDYQDSATVVGS